MQVPDIARLPDPVMTVQDIDLFLEREFPQISQDGRMFTMRHIEKGLVVLRFDPSERHLRPGGTVSGPSLFAQADVSAYVCILAHIGPVKHTVTTNLNINFMHKSEPGPLDCTCRLLKLGKRLAVVDALIQDRNGVVISQATGTYSIPKQ